MLDRLAPYETPFSADDVLVDAVKKDGIARFTCRPFSHKAIVAGRSSKLHKEVNTAAAMADGVPIYRRKGGGCSVVLDPGNLIVSTAFPAEGISGVQTLFNAASQWLLNGLIQSGIPTENPDGTSDIALGNRKVGGSCFYRAKGVAYFSCAILVSPDLDLLDRYLYHPPRTPAYRAGRSHLAFVTRLDSHYKGITVHSLARDLKQNLQPGVKSPL